MIRKLNLQLFADAGTFVNAIPNTVNAYTGAVHDTRSAATASPCSPARRRHGSARWASP